jgi:hypothetical protein
LQLQTQQQTAQTAAQNAALQREIYGRIAPFAQMLIQFGIDPIKFLQSPQGAALLAPVREQIGGSFDQARQNLVDMGAGSGFSPGSGGMMGPLANMFSSEAAAQANALQNLIAQSTSLGLQGANVLQGQQGIFNPNPLYGNSINAGQSVITAPPGSFLSTIAPALIGAAGTALGGFLGRPPMSGTSSSGGASTGSSMLDSSGNFIGICWVAAELYGGWQVPRVSAIRTWLLGSKNIFVRAFASFYLRFGYQWAQAIRTHKILRAATKLLFDSFPVRA